MESHDVPPAYPLVAPRMARLPVPFVVDHMGHFPVAQLAPDDGAFQTLAHHAQCGRPMRSSATISW